MPTTVKKEIIKKEDKNLNESIIQIRVDLQNSKIKKSGKNKYAGFDYYELADFLPKLNELMLKYGVNDKFTIEEEKATLTLIKGDESQVYNIPFERFETPLVYKKDKNGSFIKDKNGELIQIPSMQDIQYLGALNTYYKRYLYLNAFGITDGEVIDSMDNNEIQSRKSNTKAKAKEPQEEVAKVDYKVLLLEKLRKLNVDVNSYAKTHKLSAKTTQEEAKVLLDELENGVLD